MWYWRLKETHQDIYTTKIEEFVCPPNISETMQLESWNSHIVHVLPRQRTNSFQTDFTVHFISFIENNSANRDTGYPKHRPDKHAKGRVQIGAAIWQINLYYIIFSTYPYSPYVAYSYGESNCDGLHILTTFI